MKRRYRQQLFSPVRLYAALGWSALLWLAPLSILGSPVISEFLASNQDDLHDGNGLASDWIEIYNPDPVPIDLDGWHLTDNPDRLTKWVFPPVMLPAGEFLTVFASSVSQDGYVDPAGNLHTTFKLSSGGEYLALVAPDGTNVVSALAPAFPPQFGDVSYGLVWASGSGTMVLTDPANVEILVPINDSLGHTWTARGFVPGSEWIHGVGPGVGYDLNDATTATGMVAAWGLDDAVNAATAGDATRNGHDGTPLNGVTFGQAGASPETGTCASFLNGGIDVPFDIALNPPSFTFAAWVRPSSGGSGYRSVVTSRYDVPNQFGYILYISPGNEWQFWTGPGGGQGWRVLAGPAVSLDTWTHVAISFDQSTQTKTLTINGEIAATTNDQAYVPNTGRDLHLGSGNDFGDLYRLAGEIDDAVLWSEAVEPAVIQQHRDHGLAQLLTISFDPLIAIDLQSAMVDTQASCYVRMPFEVTDPSVFDRLILQLHYNDGFVASLNGTRIASRNAPVSPAWNATATALRSDEDSLDAESIDVTAFLSHLVEGTNVLTLHGLNRAVDNPDFLIGAELVGEVLGTPTADWGYFQRPSAGTSNPTVPAHPGPHIQNVTHSPEALSATQDLAVSATVSPRFDPVQTVVLHWQVMYEPEQTVPMRDDGAGGDHQAGDGIYVGVIPHPNYQPAQMVRYAVSAADAGGRASRFPAFLDTTGVNQSPAYQGTVVADPSLVSPLPILQWFTEDVHNADTRVGSRASVWFRDRFYDNIYVRQRGQATAIGSQKFNFNRGDPVYVNERLEGVGELNLNTRGADPDTIRQPLAFEMFTQSDVAACESFPVLMHRNGSDQRVGLLIEQVDEDFLRRHGFDEQGALYKMVQRYNLDPVFLDTVTGVEKKTRKEEDFADIDAFIAGILQPTAAARAAYLFDHVNLPQMINYLAAKTLVRDVDSVRKNFYFYRDSEGSGEWSMFPWDEDFTFGVANPGGYANHIYLGDSTHKLQGSDQWNVLFDAMFTTPEISAMYQRRLRTLMDRILLPPGSPPGSSLVEQRAEALVAPVQAHLGVSSAGIANWVQTWRDNLYVYFGPGGGEPLLPAAQSPQPAMAIGAIQFNPSSGNQDEEYLEVVNPNPVAVDVSGWSLSNAVSHVFPPGTVIPAGGTLYVTPNVVSFRARAVSPTGGEGHFVQGNYQGHLSNFGETLYLLDAMGSVVYQRAYVGDPTPAQQFLVVSEIMYHPPVIAEAEYIEVMNISATDTLDLSGVRFTRGIAFDFTAGGITQLLPGARALVVRDLNAFQTTYGSGHPVAGVMSMDTQLDNAGETLKLEDAGDSTIKEFAYDDRFPWPSAADGLGYSLTLIRPAENPDPAQPSNWRSSVANGGSPGTSDATTFSAWALDQGMPGALPGEDPDADGVPNVFEYGYYSPPLTASAGLGPEPGIAWVATATETNAHFTLSVRRYLAAEDLGYLVDYSPGLLPWQSGDEVLPVAVVPRGDGTETWIYRVPEPVGPADHLGFLRLRIRLIE